MFPTNIDSCEKLLKDCFWEITRISPSMMRVRLLVDSREKALYTSMAGLVAASELKKSVDLQSKTLNLGDIQVILEDSEKGVIRDIVVERKTQADMLGSIFDGRYREQKARLLSNVENKNICYVIEGDDICQSVQRKAKNMSTAYLNMIFRDDIHLIFTRDVRETAILLVTLATKMLEKPANYTPTDVSAANTDYTSRLKLKAKKNHNITPENCFIMQLAQIPSVSNIIAKKIAAVFPTPASLVDAMRACPTTSHKIKLLAGIDKVGKAKATAIIQFMQLV